MLVPRLRHPLAATALVTVLLGACTPVTGADSGGPPATPSPSVSSPGTAAPTTQLPAPAATPDTRLRIGLDRDPATVIPAAVSDDAGRLVVDAVFDSLTSMSPDLEDVEPAAAVSWSASPDHRRWSFQLRPEARWHDGLPVTAPQFVRAFNHVAGGGQSPPGFNAHLLRHVEGFDVTRDDGVPLAGVRALGPLELEIRLSRSMADLPAQLSDPALAPRRLALTDRDRPVGNGPFAFADPWAHNQFIRVAAVADHWNRPLLDEVLFQIYAQAGSDALQLEDFRAGVLDVASVPPTELGAVRALFGPSSDGYAGPGLLDGETDNIYYLGFNTTAPPFDDPDVRMGIAQLIDRDRIIQDVTQSSRSRASGIVPSGLPGGGVVECDPCRHDPLAARNRLDGVFDGLDGRLRLLTPEGVTNERVAAIIADDIRAATGIAVQVVERPLGEYVESLRAPDLQLFRAGWEATRPTMGGVLEPLFSSSEIEGDNLARFSDQTVDQALALASRTTTPALRIAAWQRAEREILDLAVSAPIFTHRLNLVVDDAVEGFRMNAAGRVDLAAVSVAEE